MYFVLYIRIWWDPPKSRSKKHGYILPSCHEWYGGTASPQELDALVLGAGCSAAGQKMSGRDRDVLVTQDHRHGRARAVGRRGEGATRRGGASPAAADWAVPRWPREDAERGDVEGPYAGCVGQEASPPYAGPGPDGEDGVAPCICIGQDDGSLGRVRAYGDALVA